MPPGIIEKERIAEKVHEPVDMNHMMLIVHVCVYIGIPKTKLRYKIKKGKAPLYDLLAHSGCTGTKMEANLAILHQEWHTLQ